MSYKNKTFLLIFIVTVCTGLLFFITNFTQLAEGFNLPFFSVIRSDETSTDYNEIYDITDITEQKKLGNQLPPSKPQEVKVRALYVTAHTFADENRFNKLLEILDATELNAIVLDIKDYTGHVYTQTSLDVPNQLGIVRPVLKNLKERIDKLHQKGIYVIARQTVFQDPALAESKTEWALRNKSGGIWKDYKGLSWVDISKTEVWDYNIALAKDTVSYGFDEINFDYIRFPSDGSLKDISYTNYDGSFSKEEIVTGFFARLYTELKHQPVYLSADLFGLTTVRRDDMSIGQKLENAAPFFDYIMPMMYPSHYPNGFLGLANPSDNPYKILYNGVSVAVTRIQEVPNNRSKIRPWIQDFDIGANYTKELIDAQILAIEDAGGYGYASWNARNVYIGSEYPLEITKSQ